MLIVHDLSSNVEVRAETSVPPLSAALESEVAALWRAERERRGPELFDGRIFSVESLARERISGCFVPYRWLIAQRTNPALVATLRVRPLGVSGLLACADGFVFGRRGAGLTDDAGLWELVPSGGVAPECADASGRVDIGCQIRAELAEEIGLDANDVAVSGPFGAFEVGASRVVDIALALATSLSGDAVLARHVRRGNPEYTEVAVVAESAIPAFVAAHDRELVAVARAILVRKGLLAG